MASFSCPACFTQKIKKQERLLLVMTAKLVSFEWWLVTLQDFVSRLKSRDHLKIPSSSLVVKGLQQEQTWIVRWWICSHKTELLCFYQGYLYFTFIWACTTSRTNGRKDGQILPWSQDWLCSEGGERWETWARKNKYLQDIGLRGEYHPVSLSGE